MKHLITLIFVAFTLTSCLNTVARDETVLPAAQMAWGVNSETGVRANTVRGIDDALEDGDINSDQHTDLLALVVAMDFALENGTRESLRTIPWDSMLRPYADRGIQDLIDDGKIHELIAPSLYTRVNNFSVSFETLLLARIPIPDATYNEYWLPNGGGRVTDQTAIAVATTH